MLGGSAPDLSSDPGTSITMTVSEDYSAGNTLNVSRRVKRRFCDDVSGSIDILSEMHKLFANFESKQNYKFESLNTSLNNMSLQYQEIQKSIEFFSKQYDSLLERLENTEQENETLKKRISSLENKMEFLDRNARAAMVEIRNISTSESENKSDLIEIVKNIGSAVDQPIQSTDLKDVHRLKSKNTASNPIFVEFTNKSVKENFLKSVKFFNKTNSKSKLNSAQIHLPGSLKPIYVSESLTPRAKHLFYLARDFVKKENYESCWTAYGKIFVRKRLGTPTIRIESEDDFIRLKKSTL